MEQPRHRAKLDVRQRDQEVLAEEHVELGCVQPLNVLVVDREVENDEEVVRVLVDLRPLALREDVLHVELVEAETLGERGRLEVAGTLDVNPGETVSGELRDVGTALLDDLRRVAGPASSDPGECGSGHRY